MVRVTDAPNTGVPSAHRAASTRIRFAALTKAASCACLLAWGLSARPAAQESLAGSSGGGSFGFAPGADPGELADGSLLGRSAKGIPGLLRRELAGESLPEYPHFQYVRSFHAGENLRVAFDPQTREGIPDGPHDLFVVEAKSARAWVAQPALTDVRGASQSIVLSGGSIAQNIFLVDEGSLSGDAGTGFGVAYDIVLDVDQSGTLSPGDVIDGAAKNGDRPGLYVVRDPIQAGPLDVTEIDYSVPDGPQAAFRSENTFYPTNIASMGQLPLVVISHGNGHNYRWYDHLGFHLASYGFIVMSHQNNTGPGINSASLTTMTHTDAILKHQATIAGGVLNGHINSSRMVWFGHSRGAEGIVRAYDRILTGNYSPTEYTHEDIVLLSSIAPTDFQGPNQTNPHDVNYNLWTGGADGDVNGCASCNLCQTFHLHDRADGTRMSVYLHGAGHGAFHNGGGSLVASGPCQVGRNETHRIMKGYMMPMVQYFVRGQQAGEDYFWRDYESFHPPTAPLDNACAVVDLTYRPGVGPADFVIDDFQSEFSAAVSSSGGALLSTVDEYAEGRLDDGNSNFSDIASDSMNGMTYGGPGDDTRGCVFQWSTDGQSLIFELPEGERDLTQYDFLSMRACQVTRDFLTSSADAPLTFTIGLSDENGNSQRIHTGAFGPGLEEPYPRSSCGSGSGWSNEFETIRIRLTDFQRDESALDLSQVESVGLFFGQSFGSRFGRIGLDDLMLTKE